MRRSPRPAPASESPRRRNGGCRSADRERRAARTRASTGSGCRPAGAVDGGDDEVDDGQRQRRDVQSDGVVDPEPAERRAAGAGDQLGHDVAHRVGEQREDQRRRSCTSSRRRAIRGPRAKKPGRNCTGGEHDRHHDEGVHDERKLGPLERLADAGEHQHPARARWSRSSRGRTASSPSRRLVTGRPVRIGTRVVEERQERVAQPAEHDALRVGVAQAAPARATPRPAPGPERSTGARR